MRLTRRLEERSNIRLEPRYRDAHAGCDFIDAGKASVSRTVRKRLPGAIDEGLRNLRRSAFDGSLKSSRADSNAPSRAAENMRLRRAGMCRDAEFAQMKGRFQYLIELI
jgi:hypothetical protein